MLVYKWVVKKDNLYYPLRNYGIDSGLKIGNYKPYELGKTYKTSCEIVNKIFYIPIRNRLNSLSNYRGFHFWKHYTNKSLELYNNCLKKRKKIINSYLICEVDWRDIFVENDYQLVAKRFKVLQNINI